MADGVDAAMDAVQAAGCDGAAERAVTEGEVEQLSSGDHAVLVGGELSERAPRGLGD